MKFQKIFFLLFCLNTAISFAQSKVEVSSLTEDDSIQKFLKEKKLQQNWNDISSILFAEINNKNDNRTQSQKKTLLSEEVKQKSQSKYFNENVLFRLVAGGYTIDVIENLTAQGLPVLDIFYGTVGNAFDRSILTANLIVIGRIDSVYNDESFADGLRSSASVTVLKTLKGDSNMKKLIIRKEGFVNNGFIVSFGSHRADLLPESGKFYLLFLSKVNYEERLSNPLLITIGGHTPKLEFTEALKQMRQQCYDASITSIDLGKDMKGLNNEKIKAKVDKVYDQCQKYGQFFPKSPLLKY